MNRSRFCCGLVAGIATVASLAHGEDEPTRETPAIEVSQERAQAWFEEGQAAYARGEFEIAAALFRAVYVAKPAPAILYDLAQAERRAGQCSAALAHYEHYLQVDHGSAPSDIDRKIAEVRACAEKEGRAAPSNLHETRPVRRTPAASRQKQAKHDTSPLRALAYGAIGGAVLTAAFGTVFLVRADAASQHLEELNTPGARWGDRYVSYQTELNRDTAAGIGFFAASAVFAAAATVVLLRWPRDSRASASSLSLGAPGSGLGASCTVPF